MSNQLEQFIRDHREEFDSEEPSTKVWENIQHPAKPAKDPEVKIVRFRFIRWAAAAVIIILAGAGIWIANRPRTNNLPEVATNIEKPAVDSPAKSASQAPVDSLSNQLAVQKPESGKEVKPQAASTESDELMGEEMVHYASLIEIKHKQLKAIEKDEPLLYRQFANDVNKLDSVYINLKKQLPKNPNREQLLEAMINNLQLQMELLNHQLNIIKQINHSKKAAYEKAYKSV
ncbi:MAG: hypothetical protein ACHQEM_00825 [Chitinophagales bacterium]